MNVLMLHIIGPAAFSPTSIAALRAPVSFPEVLNVALFEAHWAWWIGLAGFGGLMIYLGLSRADRLLQRIGAASLILATALILAALIVVTPAERLYAAHQGLAAAAKRGDVDQMLSYFASNFTINALGIHTDTTNADAKSELASRIKEYGIKDNYIRDYKFTRRGPIAVTDITVLTQSSSGSIISSWEVSWDDLPGEDWKIAKARLTALNGQAVPDEPIR
jgi:hypothetical protein